MLRAFVVLFMFLIFSLPAEAIGMNRFPFRPFDDVKRPRTADEVEISYQMLVSRRDGINELEAKITALHALVRDRNEIGYQLGSPRIIEETADQWKVAIPSHFSINQGRR